ncbi:hypothetical protein D3C81_2202170 [compost metagenome]
MASEQARRADYADLPATVVEIVAAFLSQLLQILQADIHPCDGYDFAVFDQRKG